MNLQQQIACSRATEGHNLLLLGKSGTGKSFCVKHIFKSLTEKGLKVAKTGTTGISSLTIEGVTLHTWSGYGDGRHTKEDLRLKIQNDEFYEVWKKNITSTDCLIIDEISMMSRKMFEDVEFICRNIKDPDKYLGGLQVIGVGDFFQLPPVPDHNIGDPGDFSFHSPLFNSVFPHTVILSDVVRQKERDLIQAIHETSLGTCSVESLDLLNRLSRPLPPGESPVRLCGKKFECEFYNASKLMDMEGEIFTYKADREGKESELNKLVVPHVLHLKVGCSVLLVKNLSKHLVNGMRGIVKECMADSVVVEFSGTGVHGVKTATIKRETFSVFNTKEGKVIASMSQLPLTLGYSMPIHKAQGLTLDRVEVDASNIFAPGQLGVAIVRATCKKGLRLIGFRQTDLLPASKQVTDFYNRLSSEYSDSFECCKYSVSLIDSLLTEFEEGSASSDEDSEFSDTEIYDIDSIFPVEIMIPNEENAAGGSGNVNENPDDIRDEELPFAFYKLESVFKEPDFTEKQSAIKAHLNMIKEKVGFKLCVKQIYDDINKILKDNCGGEKKTEPKNWTSFYSNVYKYSLSDSYSSHMKAFYGTDPSEIAADAFGKIVDKLIEILLEEKTETVIKGPVPTQTPVAISDAGLGNIRYIAGRCVAKAKYHMLKVVKANLYRPKTKYVANEAFTKVRMLDFVTTKNSETETKYKQSLKETARRQNLQHGLTSITDNCFDFFLSLNRINTQHQTEHNLKIFGPDCLNKTKEAALTNKGLKQCWDNLFEGYKIPDATTQVTADIRQALFEDIVIRFLRIGNNQFRKNSIRKIGKTKTESLRKKVVVEKSKTEKIQQSDAKKPKDNGKKRKQSIPDSNKTHVDTENDSLPGPSDRGSDKKRKRGSVKKGKARQSREDDTYCGYCQLQYVDGEPLVQCDECNEWFDCECQNISNREYERLSSEVEEIPWFCIECKQHKH